MWPFLGPDGFRREILASNYGGGTIKCLLHGTHHQLLGTNSYTRNKYNSNLCHDTIVFVRSAAT